MTPGSPMSSRTQLLNELEQEYSRVDQIWSQTNSISEVSGLDGTRFKEVKEHISTARDALTKARNTMSEGASG